MLGRVAKVVAIAGLVFISSTGEARTATGHDPVHRFSALASALEEAKRRDEVVRVGNELIDLAESLTATQRDTVPEEDVGLLVAMVNRTPSLRNFLAMKALVELGWRAADALPTLQRLGWESPEAYCEPEERICVRTGPPDFAAYMDAFEDVRGSVVAQRRRLPDALERDNDIRIQQGIERVLAEHDSAVAQDAMESLAARVTSLPRSAMSRLEDTTIDSIAELLHAEPGIRFQAVDMLAHAGARAERALSQLEDAKRSSTGVLKGWTRDNKPMLGDQYIEEAIQYIREDQAE